MGKNSRSASRKSSGTLPELSTELTPPKAGPLAFDHFYRSMIGERWDRLQAACHLPSRHFELSHGLIKPYYLDPASVFAALQLQVEPGQLVLDLCAAPGGKSLVIAQQLFNLCGGSRSMEDLGSLVDAGLATSEDEGESRTVLAAEPAGLSATALGERADADQAARSQLVANERSATRRGRLRAVLSSHLPGFCQTAISTTAHDASAWGQYQQDRYDRILLDAPCSSERHLIQAPAYLNEWSPGRTKQLSQQAYAMGLSAGRALKPGGLLLYCTCALSTLENDETIARIIERSQAQAPRYGFHLEIDELMTSALVTPDFLESETTRFGAQVWPDRGDGFGPLYFCRLKKVID